MPGQGRGGCLRCFVLNKNGSVGCRELGCYISRIPAPYGECSSIGELDLAAVEALYLPLGYDVRSVYADKLGVGQLYTDIFKNHAGEGACAAGAVNLDIPFHSLDKSDVGEWYRHIVVFLLDEYRALNPGGDSRPRADAPPCTCKSGLEPSVRKRFVKIIDRIEFKAVYRIVGIGGSENEASRIGQPRSDIDARYVVHLYVEESDIRTVRQYMVETFPRAGIGGELNTPIRRQNSAMIESANGSSSIAIHLTISSIVSSDHLSLIVSKTWKVPSGAFSAKKECGVLGIVQPVVRVNFQHLQEYLF